MASQPKIDNRLKDQKLSLHEKRVLQVLFANYQTVVVLSEFTEGQRSSRVFRVRPIQEESADLLAIVKIDSVAAIAKEWKGYQDCIQNKLPAIAAIQNAPVYPPGNPLGGLRYTMAGEGVFSVISLGEFVQKATLEQIEGVLSRLFRTMNTLWEQRYVQNELYLQTAYDAIMPVNLTISLVTDPPEQQQVKWLEPSSARGESLQPNDFLQFRGFQPVAHIPEEEIVLFNSPDSEPPFHFYLKNVTDKFSYVIGEVIEQPLLGQVEETRDTFLTKQVQLLFQDEDPLVPTLVLGDDVTLPNPLLHYANVLSRSFDAYIACIHGDLHLKNVLVEQDHSNSYLIDFGESHQDHILKDLLYLEMSVITHLMPMQEDDHGISPELLIDFYTQLHCEIEQAEKTTIPDQLERPFLILKLIRQAAKRYLFRDWQEYYDSLGLYLLSALKDDSLDPAAKKIAYWGSAISFSFSNNPPSCSSSVDQETEEAVSSHLPPKAYHQLIGRSDEKEKIISALRQPDGRSIVVLVGLGGMGKTAIARETVDLCQQEALFEHIVWTSAKTEHFIGEQIVTQNEVVYDFDVLLSEIARQCQRIDVAGMPLEQKKTAITYLLAEQRVLIVLDNLETIPEYDTLVHHIAEILGQSKLLITSRHRVTHDRAFTIALSGFPDEDGITFLRTEGQERNLTAVVEAPNEILLQIQQDTGGAPLAMKLVIGQLSRQPMDVVLQTLKEASAQGQDYEFYSFVYWYSWNLLQMPSQMALVDISVFPPTTGGAKEDVIAVSQLGSNEFWPAMDQLVTMSLVDKIGFLGQERFALHPLTHYFILADITQEWKEDTPPDSS